MVETAKENKTADIKKYNREYMKAYYRKNMEKEKERRRVRYLKDKAKKNNKQGDLKDNPDLLYAVLIETTKKNIEVIKQKCPHLLSKVM
tara:strand:- start:3032 stop:3298 length:267 start_codon:yes stop_codon:yes gene_type:complete